MAVLSDDELRRFLAEPLVATLATYRRDGTVLLSPVWQEWTGDAFHVLVGTRNVKVRHLRNDPRAGLVVYEQQPPYRGVEARGRGNLLEGRYADVLSRMAPRYLPEGLPSQLARDGLVLELVPEELRTWTFETWFTA